LMRHYQKTPRVVQWLMQKFAERLPAARTSAIKEYFLLLKRFLGCQANTPMLRHINLLTCFQDDAKARLLAETFPPHLPDASETITKYYKRTEHFDDLTRALWADFYTYLPDDLLVKEDRMTMAASLEGRVPFLDHELVEFVAAMPAEFKVHKMTTKYILKEALTGLLPKSIIERKKHGFAVPIGEWFKKDLNTYATEVFHDQKTIQRGWFNQEYILALLQEHQTGTQDYSSQLWALLMFELWCREYLDKK
jgi:asparagine synthase (glutamine-hydrolysing)